MAADLQTAGVGPLDVSDVLPDRPALVKRIEMQRRVEAARDVPREMDETQRRAKDLLAFQEKPKAKQLEAQHMPIREAGSEFLAEAGPGDAVRHFPESFARGERLQEVGKMSFAQLFWVGQLGPQPYQLCL